MPFLARLVGLRARLLPGFRAPDEAFREPDATERAALADLAETLRGTAGRTPTPRTIQTAVYEVGKRHPFPELRAWFGCLYQVLLGQEEGRASAGSSRCTASPRRCADRRGAARASRAGLRACGPRWATAAEAACCATLPALLGVVLLVGAIYVVQREFRNLKLEDIAPRAGRRSRPARWRSPFVLDRAVLRHADLLRPARHDLCRPQGQLRHASPSPRSAPMRCRTISASPRCPGAAVRYRLYAHWGLTPLQIAKVVAFCSLTFGLGGMVLGGAILFVEPERGAVLRRPSAALGAVCASARLLWAVVGAYVTLSRVLGVVRAVRPRGRTAGLAHGDPAGAAGDRRRGGDRRDLLRAAADGAGLT